jgi:hypothetical protein
MQLAHHCCCCQCVDIVATAALLLLLLLLHSFSCSRCVVVVAFVCVFIVVVYVLSLATCRQFFLSYFFSCMLFMHCVNDYDYTVKLITSTLCNVFSEHYMKFVQCIISPFFGTKLPIQKGGKSSLVHGSCQFLAVQSNGTSITEKSVTQNHVLFTSRQTEYSLMQVPLDVKEWHQYHGKVSNSKTRDIY